MMGLPTPTQKEVMDKYHGKVFHIFISSVTADPDASEACIAKGYVVETDDAISFLVV